MLKLCTQLMNFENGRQKKEVDNKKFTCQTIKSGKQLPPEGKENWPLTESKSENLILTSARGAELEEMLTIPRSPSCPSFFSGETS